MVIMYTSDSVGNTLKQGIPVFRNPCGRRGCDHIFEYAGPNPLGNIQRLVIEHLDHCRGQSPLATHLLRGRSQQNIGEMRQPMERDENARNEYRSLSPQYRRWSPSPSPEDMHAGPSEGGTSSRSSPTMGGTQGLSSASTAKKSARSEAERRRALETDPWTLSVTPHEVVCRGCRRTIKLDRRSRYYPGLWEKHRDRCDHVIKIRDLTEPEVPVDTSPQPIPFPSTASSSTSRFDGSDPTALAARKSCES
ncbi:hypothetical protein C8F04DRAFT_529264 [Mycena alexandri]|uniref:Uncharacterized protein n=1 Tax=Mycena alexandri TaxID=1745969 RepID=A0AAD6X576_9AGAR|nr:hypothetical protein C8F04DRAFT_529264 [Mycena alexandri]